MTRNELIFFFDSLFRTFSKLLIVRGETAPSNVNVRLASADLLGMASIIVPGDYVKKGDFCKLASTLTQSTGGSSTAERAAPLRTPANIVVHR